MANLSASEIRKYEYRSEVFIRKIKEKEPFEVTGNKKVVIVGPKNYEKILRNGTNKDLNDMRFGDTKGGVYKLSDFVKNKDFGGKGAGSGTAKEDAALSSLRKQIADALKKEGRPEITVKIDGKNYQVTDAVSTPGTPKSDFHLVDANGNEVAWISHKDGKTAKDFQQWGGMSRSKEPAIYNHKESQAFINDILNMYPDGLPRATTLARQLKDKKLAGMSIYGNEFGRAFSRQNTTLMLQGEVKLTKKGKFYEITAYHTHFNGEMFNDDYAPVFMAIYKGDRSDFGIKGTRVVISPKGSRKVTSWI